MKNNILFFAQQIHAPWIEGVKNNAIKICQLLQEKIEVNVVSHRGPQNSLKEDMIHGVRVKYLLMLSDNTVLQLLHFICDPWKCLLYVIQTKPQKIFVQYLDTSYLLSLILIKIFQPKTGIILTLYSTDELSISYKKLFLKYFPFEKIIIISEYLRDSVEDIGYKKEEILYIPLSFDTKRYLKYVDFLKRDTKKILFSAGIIQEAGSFFMVDLALSMPEYQFIFALRQFNQKSERELALLQGYIEEKGVKNIEIRRNIDKMEELLGEVGALILPLQDIRVKMLIPVAILEAMARGTICFVSDLPNLKKLVTHTHNALVFPSSDIEQLREMIEKYGSDEAIAKNAYEFAKNYPSFEQIAEKYYQLI